MKTFFAYLRVSGSTQIEGDGFTGQETDCFNYASLLASSDRMRAKTGRGEGRHGYAVRDIIS